MVADCTAVSRPAAVSSATKPLVANIFAKDNNCYIFGTKPLVARNNHYHIFYNKPLLAHISAKDNHYYTFGTKPLVAKDNHNHIFDTKLLLANMFEKDDQCIYLTLNH